MYTHTRRETAISSNDELQSDYDPIVDLVRPDSGPPSGQSDRLSGSVAHYFFINKPKHHHFFCDEAVQGVLREPIRTCVQRGWRLRRHRLPPENH